MKNYSASCPQNIKDIQKKQKMWSLDFVFWFLNNYQNLEIQNQHVDNHKAFPDELNSNYCT